MNGLGNQIIVADLRGTNARIAPEAAIAINARPETRFDQIMAIHDPRTPGTINYVDIINSDGSRAQACGNGMRCVVQALTAELGRQRFTFETVAGVLFGEEAEDGQITVDMGTPKFAWYEIPLNEEFADTRYVELQIGPIDAPVLHSPSVVSMGNPHATFWVKDDVWSFALDRFGLRTWERGAGLTQACGTAACAALVNGARTRRTARKATITVPGGDLVVEWLDNDHVTLTGPAEFEWRGDLNPTTGAWTRSEAA
jgi:diaminopimelate epimerase